MRSRRATLALGPLALVLVGWLSAASISSEPRAWTPPAGAELPAGFPAPTRPGEIVVKAYPAARGAFVHADGAYDDALSRSFRALYRHIGSAGVPMTAPVVAAYPETVVAEDRGLASVAFLYPSGKIGAVGRKGEVTVADFEPLVVVSVGILGPYDTGTLRAALRDLEHWLEENAADWKREGVVRRLMYERPSWLKGSRLYSEIQIAIRPASPRIHGAGGTDQ